MKYIIFILGSFAIIASAELPSNIPDQKVRDSVEYIDGKANKAYSITRKFESSTSTVSVSGWMDIGVETISATGNCGADIIASCSSGKRVLGGGIIPGTSGGIYVRGTYPVNNNSWKGKADCTSGAGSVVVYAICARVK